MKGVIYLFKEIDGRFHKISYTIKENVDIEFETFEKHYPLGAEIALMLSSENVEVDLKSIHDRYESKRVGDSLYFNLSPDDVKMIARTQTKEHTELRKFYWTNIVFAGVSLDDLKRALKKAHKYKEQREGVYEASDVERLNTLHWIEVNLSGTQMTNGGIIDIMRDSGIDTPTPNALGRMLKTKYKQKLVTVDGSKQRLYYL